MIRPSHLSHLIFSPFFLLTPLRPSRPSLCYWNMPGRLWFREYILFPLSGCFPRYFPISSLSLSSNAISQRALPWLCDLESPWFFSPYSALFPIIQVIPTWHPEYLFAHVLIIPFPQYNAGFTGLELLLGHSWVPSAWNSAWHTIDAEESRLNEWMNGGMKESSSWLRGTIHLTVNISRVISGRVLFLVSVG